MKFLKYSLVVLAMSLATLQMTAQDKKKGAQDAAAEAAKAIAATPQDAAPAPPKPVYWKKNMQTRVSFNQTNLSNWAAGGVNNVTLASFIDANANYAKDKTAWTNRLQLDYGFIYQQDRPFIQKNTDRIYLESKCAHRATDKFNYTAQYNLRSQFTNTYNYPTPSMPAGEEPTKKDWKNGRNLQSGFFSPAYTNLALGMEWIPNPKNRWLVVNFAPLTGGFTVVADSDLRRNYGMKRRKDYQDEAAFPYDEAKTDGTTIHHGDYYRYAKFQLGAQLKVDLNVKVNQNFTYSSQLVLFSDYLEDPQNMRVNFDNRVNWLIAKYFTLSLSTFLIYDDNVMIKNEKDIDKYPNGKQRVQFRELIGFGFTYNFPNK